MPTTDWATPAPASPDQEREWMEKDFGRYARICLRIQSKEAGALIPFEMNFTQRVIHDEIVRLRAAGMPPRIIVLKSRQVGVSTLTEGMLFHECHLYPNESALVLAHNMKSSKALFRMTKRFAENLPPEWSQKRRYDNIHEIQFMNGSRLQVETVGEVRGYTATKVHLSELAFYEQAEETMQAVMQTVPRTVSSLAVIESTANGAGNEFHRIWVEAIHAKEQHDLHEWEKGWTPIFIPWFKHPEYMMTPWFPPSRTTQVERVLAKRFGLNMRQLAWRRWCISSNCRNDPQVFEVEYPSTWREAFRLSGRLVFDPDELAYYTAAVPPETPADTLPAKEEIELVEDGLDKWRRMEVEEGRLRIYEPPIERHQYILGADPSEGDRKSDPSPIEVLDRMTLDHVAEWHGRQPPDVLAKTAMALGYYYNAGMIAPEANNHGILFNATLSQKGYPSVYFRETDPQSVSGKVGEKPGFLTTNKSKHAAFDTLRAWVREHRGKTRSPILVSEMTTLIYFRREHEQETKIIAQPGCFRDAVTAFAIALWAHRGTEAEPLEPLPMAEIEAAAQIVSLLRERDPEKAELHSMGVLGLTCDQIMALDEAWANQKAGRDSFATESMR